MRIALLLCMLCAVVSTTSAGDRENTLKKLLLRLLDEETDKSSEHSKTEEKDDVKEEEEIDDHDEDLTLRGLIGLEEYLKCHKCEKKDIHTRPLYCRVSEKNVESGEFEVCEVSQRIIHSGQRFQNCKRKEGSKCTGEVKECESKRCVLTSGCNGPITCEVYTKKCHKVC